MALESDVEPNPLHRSGDHDLGKALRLVHEAWAEMQTRTQAHRSPREIVLPHFTFEAAERRSARASRLADDVATLQLERLPAPLRISVEIAAWHARRWRSEAEWFFTVFDPSGGWYGPFAATAYNGGYFLNSVLTSFGAFAFDDASDLDRYLALIADFVRVIDEFRERTAEQTRRGMYMPCAQLEQAIPLLAALRARSMLTIPLEESRLGRHRSPAFAQEVMRRAQTRVAGAFDAFLELLGPAYAAKAPDDVGLGQYADGPEIYAELVRQHTTLDVVPAEVHALGTERMMRIRAEMLALIADTAFAGDPHAFYDRVNAEPRWRADTAGGVADVFRRYTLRLAPKLNDVFFQVPRAPYDVEPLAAALEGAMTFGYYQQPTPQKPVGTYVFNARNLTRRGLVDVGPLTYHELMPGHHLHIAGQLENETLDPLRRHSLFNAFNEGWAEYAATLAGDMGMYETTEERFARLVSDAFLTSRLVVDTGMNALGWSLEAARLFMRDNTMLSQHEIPSETLRYSCDIPAQALAYKSGEPVFLRLREKMRAAFGKAFDIREFHDIALRNGSMPFNLLELQVDAAIAARHT